MDPRIPSNRFQGVPVYIPGSVAPYVREGRPVELMTPAESSAAMARAALISERLTVPSGLVAPYSGDYLPQSAAQAVDWLRHFDQGARPGRR